MRGPRLIYLLGSFSHCYKEKKENFNQFVLSRKWRYWHSKPVVLNRRRASSGGRQYTSRGRGLLCALQHAQFDQ